MLAEATSKYTGGAAVDITTKSGKLRRTLLGGHASEAVDDARVGRDLAALDTRVGVLHIADVAQIVT